MEWKRYIKQVELDDGMVRIYRQPHTREIEALPSCCCGRSTGNYYFLCKYYGLELAGEAVLRELAKLQDTDETSATYGCLRWYREETYIYDTNGAFFVLQPIALAFLLCGDRISEEERKIMEPVFDRAGIWFGGECEHYGYHYPNKIISDGAMLLAIGTLTGNPRWVDESREFWDGWLAYTKEYGWGWGENTSECYSAVIVGAMNLALCCLKEADPLYEKIYEVRGRLLDYVAYHENYEFVPSIRTYNFSGMVANDHEPNIFNMKANFDYFVEQGGLSYEVLTALTLHEAAPAYEPKVSSEILHRERIFGDSYATTYKGENIRLGTVSHFPVMPGCYQEDGWGLGWQSMPVSVLALKHETSFLRFANVVGGELRTHIAYDKHYAFLNTSIFVDENIPDFSTWSDQENNTAVVVRTLSHVANKSSYLADEWYLQHFDGMFAEYKDWCVFHYGDCVLAVKPLNGRVTVTRDGENIRVAQVLYQGEEKLLVLRECTTAWAVVVLDKAEDWERQLDSIHTSYEEIKDLRFPRVQKPFRVTCGAAELVYDLYKNPFPYI